MAITVKWLYPPNYNYGTPPENQGWRRVTVQLIGDDIVGEGIQRVIDISELRTPSRQAPRTTAVEWLKYDIDDAVSYVELFWDRAPREVFAHLTPGQGEFDYRYTGGMVDNGESGDGTGDIMVDSSGIGTGKFMITMCLRLKD